MFERLDQCRIGPKSTLLDALRALEASAAEITLICEPGDKLVGILTDGDIRRALLKGATLDATVEPWMTRSFTSVRVGAGRAEVVDMMRARTISGVPVIDEQGRLRGLHLLHELLGSVPRQSWAVIMAGGKGTRLRPLTEDLPKPMIKVAGRPILERIVLHLAGFGIRRIFLSVNYLPHVIEDYFADGARLGCQIEYLREKHPLGTAGSLSLLPEKPSRPLILMNGDLVTEANIGGMLDFHEASAPTAATMGVRRYYHTVPFGCVDIEGDRVTRMEEKPQLSRMVNAGIYVLSPETVARVPKDAEVGVPTILQDCIDRAENVRAFEIQEDWLDIGQRDQLKAARGEH